MFQISNSVGRHCSNFSIHLDPPDHNKPLPLRMHYLTQLAYHDAIWKVYFTVTNKGHLLNLWLHSHHAGVPCVNLYTYHRLLHAGMACHPRFLIMEVEQKRNRTTLFPFQHSLFFCATLASTNRSRHWRAATPTGKCNIVTRNPCWKTMNTYLSTSLKQEVA